MIKITKSDQMILVNENYIKWLSYRPDEQTVLVQYINDNKYKFDNVINLETPSIK